MLFTKPTPGSWRDHFARRMPIFDGRVVLEIGCFDAAFLSRVATRHPTTGFVGLDWKVKPLVDAAERGVPINVALIQGRAQLLRDLFAGRELDEAWLFHPDPCDRDVELPNRLFRGDWLRELRILLRDEGRSTLMLKTDHPGYYQWACATLGIDAPEWFASRDRSLAPKTRWGDLMPVESLPPRDAAIPFRVTLNSADFWRDEAAQRHVARRAFAGEATLFEQRFVRRNEPIYAIELTAL